MPWAEILSKMGSIMVFKTGFMSALPYPAHRPRLKQNLQDKCKDTWDSRTGQSFVSSDQPLW